MDCQDPCPRYERAMSILGKKWTCLMLRCLMEEPRRFSDISAYVKGLSDRLLSQRLQELEEAGIVSRQVYAQRPVVVEYSLTERARPCGRWSARSKRGRIIGSARILR